MIGLLRLCVDGQGAANGLAVIYNKLRTLSPDLSRDRMMDTFSSVVKYCAYSLLGISVPSLIIYILYPPIFNDLTYLSRYFPLQSRVRKYIQDKYTILDKFESLARTKGSKTFLLYDDKTFTYSEVNRQANRIMNYLVGENKVKMGDVICLLMYNEPAFVWTWLGIIKCLATASLLNTRIQGKSLLHCIKISGATKIICGSDDDLIEVLKEIKSELDGMGIDIYVIGASDNALLDDFKDLTQLSSRSSEENRDRNKDDTWSIDCVHIYTSGTTGLPKAAKLTQRRFMGGSNALTFYDVGPDDVYYVCLPLYHSAALVIGLSTIINSGGTAALRKRFSVREFWKDVRRFRATIIHYIGETARYLVQVPRSDQDGVYPHGSIRLAIGNGLPADIWEEFQSRFNIKQIVEFYAATDGNFMTTNYDGKVGTVGRITPLLKRFMIDLQILECDLETAEPKRDQNGLCILCPRGKAGLLASQITVRTPLEGYVGDRKLTDKKIIKDVIQKGDSYFNSGDLMLIDEDGYIYFKDRIGNTFRWKGENVATTEVELALLESPQVESANVYGVKIEGADGRAGMASLILRDNGALDGPALYEHITERLPGYACPMIVRIKDALEVTGTFKLRKVNLMREGFDPKIVKDPLFYMNKRERTYSPLDEESFNTIQSGAIRM